MALLGTLTSGKNLGSEYSGLSKRRRVYRPDPRESLSGSWHDLRGSSGKKYGRSWGQNRVWIWMPLMNIYQGTWTSFWCSVIVEVIWAEGILEAGQGKATLLSMYTMHLWGLSQRSCSGGVTETSKSLNESNLSGNGGRLELDVRVSGVAKVTSRLWLFDASVRISGHREFADCPVVRTLCFHAESMGLAPDEETEIPQSTRGWPHTHTHTKNYKTHAQKDKLLLRHEWGLWTSAK